MDDRRPGQEDRIMRTSIGRLIGATLIVIVAAACAGGSAASTSPAASVAATAAGGDLVGDIDIGGRTLSVACLGPSDTGRPTVIFESGLGGDRRVWGDVLTGLMATDRGCSYDRAGVGASQPGPKPQTTDGQVDDLHAMLEAAGIEPPYVFVAHSSGGWNAIVFAGRYPDEVAGAVMVDVRPPATSEQWLAALPPESSTESDAVHQTRAELTDFEGDPSRNPEGLDLIESATQAKAAPGFGDAPLVVLTAGDRAAITEGLPADLGTTFDGIWMDLQAGLVDLSTSGRQEIVPDATHDMPFEQPGVIVDAIRDVLGTAAG
jgi:pimeloyl-ACP methyl ester carboxylesterase